MEDLPNPQSLEETYLKYIAQNGGGSLLVPISIANGGTGATKATINYNYSE